MQTSAAWVRRALMALAVVPLTVASLVNFGRGVGLDQDGQMILGVVPLLRSGSYQPSRTSGYPLYEYLAAAVNNLTALKVISVILTVLTLVVLAQLVRPQDRWIGLLAWSTYALLPGTIANATAVIEVPLFALLVVLMVWLLLATDARWTLLVVAALVVLARPDGSLLVLTTAGVFALWRRERRAGLVLTVGVAVAAAVILLINRGIPETGLLTEPMLRTAARATVSMAVVTNVVGLIGLLVLVLGLLLAWRSSDPDEAFFSRWLLLVLVVVGLRFLMLPDELDYLVGGVLVLLALAPRVSVRSLTRWGVVVTLVAMASTSVVTMSLLQRDDLWDAAPSLAPSINSGGVVQDIEARRAETIRNSPAYRAYFDQGSGALVLPREMWYQIFAPRFAADYMGYERLMGCEGLTNRSEPPGWRLSQPAGTYQDVEIFLRGQPVSCTVVARNRPGGWQVLQ